ncbi:PEBP1 family protein [Megaselia abdita]
MFNFLIKPEISSKQMLKMLRSTLLFVFLVTVFGNEELNTNEDRGLTSNFPFKFFNKNQVRPLCFVMKSEKSYGDSQVQCVFIGNSPDKQNYVVNSFSKAGIVPDVISVAPTKYLHVKFPTGVEAQLGNILTPTLVQYKPHVTWKAQKGALYTLLFADPDVPSRSDKSMGEVRHWMVVNIPGNKVDKGQTVFEYIGSAPDPGSGFHRYVFLVFKQNSWINTNEYYADDTSTDQQGRFMTKARQLMQMYNLGKPIYGNFYEAEFDPTAIIVREKLGVPIIV